MSGAGIEDLAMFAAMVADRPGTRAVILSVDPWMLKVTGDTRYTDIIETHARAVAMFWSVVSSSPTGWRSTYASVPR